MVAKKTTANKRKPARRANGGVVERRRAPRRKDEGLLYRVYFSIFLLAIGFCSMGAKLVWVGMVPVSEPTESPMAVVAEMPKRGDIYDRNGALLATTLEVQSLYADPAMMMDVKESIHKLSTVLPSIDQEKLVNRLSSQKRRFAWVERQLTPVQVKAVNDLGIPGFAFRKEEARVYPQQNLASHLLGGVGVDGRGLAGVESSYNEALSRGEDLHLAMDVRLQQQLRDALVEQWKITEAKAVWGVIVEPETGDVLAMASLPDYDPNRYGDAPQEAWMNKVISGTYEMGSTFKTFTIAQGLESGLMTTETEFDCTKPLKVGRFRIRDSHPKYKWMSVEEIFQRSSNIGSARIADTFAEGEQREFFASLGLLDPMDVGLGAMPAPRYPNRWGRIHTMSMSYGHGIAITPMHLVSAIAAVSYDGVYRTPHVVKNAVRQTPHRVLKPETVTLVQDMMRNVVENGTGRRARVAGYDIGGKTGTSEKAVAGGYSREKNIASFVGIVPADNPKFVSLMMVDEGKKDHNSGGTAAAPAFAAFLERAAPVVGMRPELFEAQYAREYVEERFSRASLRDTW